MDAASTRSPSENPAIVPGFCFSLDLIGWIRSAGSVLLCEGSSPQQPTLQQCLHIATTVGNHDDIDIA